MTRPARAAQTQLELYDELIAAGWPAPQLECARRAFELASRLFAQRARPSGKPFVCHVVGVASLARRHGASPEWVIAALLHSAYTHGDFGGLCDAEQRALVRAVVGEEVERRIRAYATWPWGADVVRGLAERLDGGDVLRSEERELVRVRLANELEDLIGGGEELARPGSRTLARELEADLGLLAEIAGMLPVPALAAEFAEATRELRARPRPPTLIARYAPRVVPRAPRQRVLLFRDGAGRGGAVRLMALLAERLPGLGPDVLLALAGSQRERAAEWLRREGLVVEPLALPDGRVARFRALARTVRERRIDVLNSHSEPRLSEVLAARFGGARCVVSPHVIREPGRLGGLRWRLAFRLCSAIVVADEHIEAHLSRHGAPVAKLRRIASGIALAVETPAREPARRRLGLEPSDFAILCVARLASAKGVDRLIEEVACIRDPAARMRLLIAGDGPQRRRLVALAAEKLGSRARLLGFVDDPADLYAAADVFALASRIEGGPFVIREAAMHGLPSVAYDVGAMRAVLHDERTGLLVEPGAPGGLARAIERLAADDSLRDKLARGARDWAHAESDADRMAGGYALLFAELAARSCPSAAAATRA